MAIDEKASDLAVGVDLGGTKIAAGLFDREGRALGGLSTVPTEAHGPPERTIENLLGAVGEALARAEGRRVIGIGFGSTGPLDPTLGVLLEAESLPRLHGFPLKATVEARIGVRVSITNDGNAFALAEALHGAGRGRGIVVGVTLGTGCGCGVVIHGRILEGATANTGELYRAPVAGATFDEVLSGRGLARLYLQEAGREAPGADISRLADAGDPAALRAFGAFGRTVAQGLGIIASIVDPHVFVLGGSVAASFRHFEGSLQRDLPAYVAPQVAAKLEIVPSALGPGAGALGGAALVFSGETIR
ncbi:MAG: ROK family protein [Planctomycetes bacterium]|nr:ROK family protein [Planctomycetota bacterium]